MWEHIPKVPFANAVSVMWFLLINRRFDLSAIFPVSTLLFKLFWNNRNSFEARWELPHEMKTQ